MRTIYTGAFIDSGMLHLQVMHDRLLDKVFSLPMAFFDTQPSGRLISRFTNDVSALDSELPSAMSTVVECIVGVTVSTAVLVVVTRGAVLLALLALLPMYMYVQNLYVVANRELNRLEKVSSSPVLTHYGETVTGLMTLRAFRKQVRLPLHGTLKLKARAISCEALRTLEQSQLIPEPHPTTRHMHHEPWQTQTLSDWATDAPSAS